MSIANNTSAPFLPTSIFYPVEEEEKRVKEISTYRDIANAVNARQLGTFEPFELPTGQYFASSTNSQQKRQTFRKVVSFSPLAAGLNVIPHGIPGIGANFTFTHIYGTGRNAAGSLQVPFPQGGANTSMLEVNTTDIRLTIPAAYAGFSALFVLEYLKN